jgi:hypothetical protein
MILASVRASVLTAAILALTFGPAAAQIGGVGAGMPGGVNRRGAAPAPAAPAPPPALPGAQSGAATPSQRVPTDMPPTESLFDGVNRGDIAAVRDALSRGADLNAVNVLGITATDLAVDLGRNDISFLLLSMRGANTAPRAPREPVAAPAPSPRQAAQPRTVAAGKLPVASEAISAPRLFAHDGGAPVPSAGFLGFDPAGR